MESRLCRIHYITYAAYLQSKWDDFSRVTGAYILLPTRANLCDGGVQSQSAQPCAVNPRTSLDSAVDRVSTNHSIKRTILLRVAPSPLQALRK